MNLQEDKFMVHMKTEFHTYNLKTFVSNPSSLIKIPTENIADA